MFERIKCVLIKEFLQIFRDPRMKVTIFVGPLLQIIIFGYAATTDIKHIPTAVYDLDNTYESRELIRRFGFTDYFDIKYYIYDEKEIDYLINSSRASAVLRFNRGFGRDLRGNRTAEVQLIVDGTDSNTASIVLGYGNSITEKFASQIVDHRARVHLKRVDPFPKVDLRDRKWFNENLESRNYYIPGTIAVIITVMSLLLTSMAIVREKEIGTMEQLMVSPISSFELILGKVTPFIIIALAQVTLITTIGVLWFHIPIRGSIPLLFMATLIYLSTSLGAGLFISTISSTQQEAVMSTFLFFFPVSLLSGFMFPIANMPKIIQYVTYLNPLRYYIVILRGLFLKGVGIRILWPQILILFIMGAGIITLSSLRFKKTTS
ncbi:ABC transporter permease [Candidatus Omnitrophota bacterium]